MEFVRNIYGDEIISWGYKRSVWSCKKCGKVVGMPTLVNDCEEEEEEVVWPPP